MSFFKVFKKQSAPASGGALSRDVLPQLHGFVEVAIGNSRNRESIPVNEVSAESFATRSVSGLEAGMSADFLYVNVMGRFKFATRCIAVDDKLAYFAWPQAVKTIENFSAKRNAVRLDSMIPALWRYAPGGEGNGEFVKASLTDLSRTGTSLVVGRDLKVRTQVEISVSLNTKEKPLVILAQVMRAAKIETSANYSAGLRFLNIDASGEAAIDAFISGRHADRRARGMV